MKVKINLLRWSIFTFIHNRSTHTSRHFTAREDMNSINWPCSQCVASELQLIEHRTVTRSDPGFESRWSPDFFQASSFRLLKLEIYCDDQSLLSSTTAVHIWIISYILHKISLLAPSLCQQRTLVSPSSYARTIINQSARVLSLGCFLLFSKKK